MNLHTSLQGEYRLVINRQDGSQQDTGWFPNLILNQGLDRLGLGTSPYYSIIRYAHVGSGTTAPAATQTGLVTFVAAADNSYRALGFTGDAAESASNEGAPGYGAVHTWKFAFAQGAVVGNITEIGVGWDASGNTLFSRALILDSGGSPTTITLVNIDQLTVYYRIRAVPVLTDASGTIDISGTTYSYTIRAANVASFAAANTSLFGGSGYFSSVGTSPIGATVYPATSTLGTVTGAPSGTPYGVTSVTQGSYTTGNYYRDATFNWDINSGNAPGGIGAIKFNFGVFNDMQFQMSLSPAIPKDNVKTFSIVMRHSWARA